MSYILAIETAINSHSIALLHRDQIDIIKSSELFKQSDNLFIHINEILARNQLSYQDLDKVAVTIGPGSFTGIRIGIAAVRGLKKTLPRLEIVGYTTLELMAFQMKQSGLEHKRYMCLLNAFASEYYLQEFDCLAKPVADIAVISQKDLLIEEQCCYIAMLQDQELFGDQNNSSVNFVDIDAVTLLNKAIVDPDDAKKVYPLYIKPPNIHGHNHIKND